MTAATHKQSADRIVFIGDSITDGNTYPLLIAQALREAGKPVPACFNAGIGGDTAEGMRARLERDVLVHKPTLVTLSAGINDSVRGVAPTEYEADVTAIADRLDREKIPLVLVTTTILGAKHAEPTQRVEAYNAFLHRLATERGYRVAEVYQRMDEARAAGRTLLDVDQIHLTYDGYLPMTRAILDALGHADVPLPKQMKLELADGVLREWRIRVTTNSLAASETIAPPSLDATWKPYTLPEKEPQPSWWPDQERQRGFAMSLDKLIGAGKVYQGVATVKARAANPVYFNPGAQLQAIWLNGKRIYRNDGWHGWHVGREIIPAQLQKGDNTIVIETGTQFFLSVTDDRIW